MGNADKIIYSLCAGTRSWERPYIEAGYDVRSITLPDNDVRLLKPVKGVYGVVAAPPCDGFSAARFFHGKGNYSEDYLPGLEVASACCRFILACNPVFWAMENPANGKLKEWMGEPQLIFNPWQYGDNYQKTTALWGKFNIPIPITIEKPEGMVKFSMLKSKEIFPEYYGIYTRQERRAITPPGFARAFFEANK